MKFLTLAAAVSVAISDVSGHYIFQQLTIGSQKFGVFEHIRKNSNFNSPVTGEPSGMPESECQLIRFRSCFQ